MQALIAARSNAALSDTAVMFSPCKVGKSGTKATASFAQQLASSLGVPIAAPLDFGWFGSTAPLGASDLSGPPSAGNPGPRQTFFPPGK